jgi:hypothetical protein
LVRPYPTGTFTLQDAPSLAWRTNACHNGLGEMATFLSVFSKKVTACQIPLGGTCMDNIILTFIINLKPFRVV